MASTDKTNDGKSSSSVTKQEAGKNSTLPAEYDLDKNPIKYAQPDGSLGLDAHDKNYMELTLRSGKHSDYVQKLLRQRIEQRAKEFPRWPGTMTHGVRAVWIESRFWYDRERLLPDYDDDWRKYRAKYLHSLELDPREPVHVPEFETYFLNPIRRFYMKGGDFLENKIIKKFTNDRYQSAAYRVVITRGLMIYAAAIGVFYWIKYNHQKWEHWSGPYYNLSAPVIYPGHPKYPYENPRTDPMHYSDYGFTRRGIFKDLRDFKDTTTVL